MHTLEDDKTITQENQHAIVTSHASSPGIECQCPRGQERMARVLKHPAKDDDLSSSSTCKHPQSRLNDDMTLP